MKNCSQCQGFQKKQTSVIDGVINSKIQHYAATSISGILLSKQLLAKFETLKNDVFFTISIVSIITKI